MEKPFICMRCGSEMRYEEKYHTASCPKCADVKFVNKYKPAHSYCIYCSSPLAYGKFGRIRHFFCTNPECISYKVRDDERQHKQKYGGGIYKIRKIDYDFIYSFTYNSEKNCIEIVNDYLDYEEGMIIGSFYDMILSDNYYFTGIIKNILSIHNKINDQAPERDRYKVIDTVRGYKTEDGLIYDAESGITILTRLEAAIMDGDNELLLKLIEAGEDVGSCGHDTLTPMKMAISKNNTEAIKILLAHGAK